MLHMRHTGVTLAQGAHQGALLQTLLQCCALQCILPVKS
jgi:hypothetical protein